MRLIDEIENSLGTDFQLMQKAFGYLQNEKFVYGLADSGFKIRKKDLLDITLSPEPADAIFEVSKKKGFLTLDLKIKLGEELKKRKVFGSKPEDNYIFTSGTTYYFARSEKVAQMIAEFPEMVKMVDSFKDEFFNQVVSQSQKILKYSLKEEPLKAKALNWIFAKNNYFCRNRMNMWFLPPAWNTITMFLRC